MVAEDVIDDRGSCIHTFQKINQGVVGEIMKWGGGQILGKVVNFQRSDSLKEGCCTQSDTLQSQTLAN